MTTVILEDKLPTSLEQVCVVAFADVDGFVDAALAEARSAADTDRKDADRLRAELTEAEGMCRRLTGLLNDPAIAAGAKPVISGQLAE